MNESRSIENATYAVAAALVVAPGDPGLSAPELQRVLGVRDGEFGRLTRVLDLGATSRNVGVRRDGKRYRLKEAGAKKAFAFWAQDDPRNASAHRALCDALEAHWKDIGAEVPMELGTVRAHFVAAGGDTESFDVIVAIAEVLGMRRVETGASLYWVSGSFNAWVRAGPHPSLPRRKSPVQPYVGVVRQVLATRSYATEEVGDPLDRFDAFVKRLGFTHLHVWWTQVLAEARQVPQSQPVNRTVMYAALAEAMLSFVYRAAAGSNVSMRKGPNPDNPRTWRLRELIAAASTGQSPIVDERLRTQLLRLNDDRQRIHAGRMIFETDGAPLPKLDYHKGRDAMMTVDRLAEVVVEWMERHLNLEAGDPRH